MRSTLLFARHLSLILLLMSIISPAQAEENAGVVLHTGSTWRMWLGYATPQLRQEDGSLSLPDQRWAIHATPHPAEDWYTADFSDHDWPQAAGPFLVGHDGEGFGYRKCGNTAYLLMRGYFYVDDLTALNALQLDVSFRGGMRVLVNGQEVGRSYVPATADSLTEPADDYPDSAWRGPQGEAIGPINEWDDPQQFRSHVEERIRRVSDLAIPTEALRQGVNVIALELRRTATPHDLPRYAGRRDGWGTIGLIKLQLRAEATTAVRGPHQAGPRPWNADHLDPIHRHSVPTNPWAELRPLRLVLPRGGRASGQVVVPIGADMPSARIGRLSGPGGLIPDQALQLRYAHDEIPLLPGTMPYAMALLDEPSSDTSKPRPLWLTVDLDADIPAGSYTGSIEITLGTDRHQVPVQVDVADWQLPPSQEWRSWGSFWHSPFNVARQYDVEPWSAEHRRHLAPVLQLLGKAGHDVLVVNAIRQTLHANEQCILQFRRDQDGNLQPDFTGVEAYLQDYQKHAGPPRVLALYAWEHSMRSRMPVVIRNPDGSTEHASVDMDSSIWQPVISGLRQRMDALGWQDVEILIGVAHDRHPSRGIINFWQEVLPDARWLVFSHWRGTPPDRDGQRVLAGGLRVAVGETPFMEGRDFRPGTSPIQGGGTSNPGDYVMLTSLRHEVEDDSQPEQFRSAPDVSVAANAHDNQQHGGFTRIGFDYWPKGNQRQIWNWRGWNNLYRSNVRSIVAPGPDGPVSTTRYEMLVEGRHETEARLALEHALADHQRRQALGTGRVEEIKALLSERLMWRMAGDTWHPGPGWQQRSMRLYELAATLP